MLGDGGWDMFERVYVCVCEHVCVTVCVWSCLCVSELMCVSKVKSSQVLLYSIQREMWVPHMNNKETKSVYMKDSPSKNVDGVCVCVCML